MEMIILKEINYEIQIVTLFDYLNLFMNDLDRFSETRSKFEFPEGEVYFKKSDDKSFDN